MGSKAPRNLDVTSTEVNYCDGYNFANSDWRKWIEDSQLEKVQKDCCDKCRTCFSYDHGINAWCKKVELAIKRHLKGE